MSGGVWYHERVKRAGTTLEAARAAKAEASARFSKLAAVNGVGITRIGDGYGVKINLAEPPAADVELPDVVNGVPVVVEIVGRISKRGA